MAKHDVHGAGAPEPRPGMNLRRDSTLKLIASPVDPQADERAEAMNLTLRNRDDLEMLPPHSEDPYEYPVFVKHEASTNYELFYDLWFVANLEVFGESKSINKEKDLYAYVGYLSILWFTWFLAGMFDVRFVTDGLLERVIRSMHLGVMIGFSVVVTAFDPDNQKQTTFQTLSLILMLSRLILCIQYGTVIWHIRRYRKGRLPVFLAIGTHAIAALIYLGIGFRFQEGRNSRVYVVWYIVAACEALLQLGLAKYYDVLTLTGTHITERMMVLTVIVLGTGVSNNAKNVVLIVSNDSGETADGWTPATVGALVSTIALIYFFFQIYFDWVDHVHLKGLRQQIWTLLHFPFHAALLMFLAGAVQFMIWWKVQEVVDYAATEFNMATDRIVASNLTTNISQVVATEYNKTIQGIFDFYKPQYSATEDRVNALLSNFSALPDSFWDPQTDADRTSAENTITYVVEELAIAVFNSLFVSFKIDPFQGLDESDMDPDTMQDIAFKDLDGRYSVVFQYTFVSAGLVMMLMVIIFAVAKRYRSWTPYVVFRTVLFLLIGLGLALVELIMRNGTEADNYLSSPWLLPTICIVFFIVLVITHLPHPPPLFNRWRGGRSSKSHSHSPTAYGGEGVQNTGYSSVHVREVGEYNFQPWGYSSDPYVHLYPQQAPSTAYYGAGGHGVYQ